MWDRHDEPVWRQAALFLLTLGLLVVCGLILHPFLSAIVGAVVLAVATQRPYGWLSRRIGSGNLSAAIAVVLVVLSIIVPAFFLVQELGRQAFALVRLLSKGSTQAQIGEFLTDHPALMERLSSLTDGLDINNAVRATAVFLGTKLAALIGHSVVIITQVVAMLFLLFFLYRDREQAIRFASSLIPLEEDETSELLARCTDTIYATALGRVVVACVQGTLSGLAFWLLGVPGPVLWAVLTVLMAMIPVFGAVLVWAPIAVYLGLTGHWGKAAALAVWGGVIVSTIDNFLYPILVGSRLPHHTATIFLSIIGGVALFGLTGIILGPLAFTIAATLVEFWRRRGAASHTS